MNYKVIKEYKGLKPGIQVSSEKQFLVHPMDLPDYFEMIPQAEEQYFYINDRLEIILETKKPDWWSVERVSSGNCFQTQDQAERVLFRFKQILEEESF